MQSNISLETHPLTNNSNKQFLSLLGIGSILIFSQILQFPFTLVLRSGLLLFVNESIARPLSTMVSSYCSIILSIFFCLYFYSLINGKTLNQNCVDLIKPNFYINKALLPCIVVLIPTLFVLISFIVSIGNLFFFYMFFLLPPPETPTTVSQHYQSSWVLIFTVFFTPIAEEFLFRGIILRGFFTRYSVVKSIVFNSLVFGIWHLTPTQFISATLLGGLFGWLSYKTGSLIICIIAHSLANALLASTAIQRVMIITLDFPENALYSQTPIVFPLWFIGLTLCLTILCILYLHKIISIKRLAL